MKKILPFEPHKEMTSYPFYSDYLGVLNAHGYDISNILFNNFMTLYYSPGAKQIGFRNFKYMKTLFDCEKLVINYENPINSIKEQIDNNRYVEIILNCLALPFVKTERYKYHDWFIYGYDDENKCFLATGYLTESANQIFFKYRQITISYDDFKKALPKPGVKTGFEKNILYNHTFCLPKNFKVEKRNNKKIIFNLLSYCLPFPPIFFNISVYRRYAKYLNKNISSLKWFDLRNLVNITEHKKIIYTFICDVIPDTCMAEEFKTKVLDKSNLLLHLTIKYNLTHKESVIKDVISLLNELHKNEKVLLLSLLKKLLKK